MKITEITVRSGRTVPHPHRTYSTIREDVELRAILTPADDPAEAVGSLQLETDRLLAARIAYVVDAMDREYNIFQPDPRFLDDTGKPESTPTPPPAAAWEYADPSPPEEP